MDKQHLIILFMPQNRILDYLVVLFPPNDLMSNDWRKLSVLFPLLLRGGHAQDHIKIPSDNRSISGEDRSLLVGRR